ncbi:saccharopine dehydrogenase family protein [Endozoicomonas arenosclerae]|uniref:saccharopine dehydrogenase family protein n=1 Tax=Endozoicomonas arenosclerae TaxID=1633495 RepID=UPI000A685CA0|nr:saccharopine dehydrogenase NADP-binding domain-containing protein [Endozoicomonas arenosclerae]
MSKHHWMIYGANGFTGELIARQAKALGMNPILGGRTPNKVEPLAESLGLPSRCFSLDDAEAAESALSDIVVVLHCAGPFSATSKPMVDACLKTSTHYLDITGEIPVLQSIHDRDREAKAAGCMLMPGVGFDIVPTDCLAASLAQQMPEADNLELAFCGEGGTSPGTVKTMIEMLADGGRIRKDGEIKEVPAAYKRKMIRFSDRELWSMTVPWGDVCTAWYSTGIDNIEVYTATPKPAAFISRILSPVMKVLNYQPLQQWLKKKAGSIEGPNQEVREQGGMRVWGKVSNQQGEAVEAWLDVAEGYRFTVNASLAIVEKILAGNVIAGAQTPSMAYGASLVEELPDSRLELIKEL